MDFCGSRDILKSVSVCIVFFHLKFTAATKTSGFGRRVFDFVSQCDFAHVLHGRINVEHNTLKHVFYCPTTMCVVFFRPSVCINAMFTLSLLIIYREGVESNMFYSNYDFISM